MTTDTDRRHAPATQRNRTPILDILRETLPASGLVLEIASGTGEHAIHFAEELPGIDWQPSDPSADARASIAAWAKAAGLANLRAPLELDAASPDWPVRDADAIVCINMIHISPWAATEGLMRGAGHLLPAGSPLYVYGPFRRSPLPLEASNAAFDADLQRRDGAWGLREVDAVAACAAVHGLALEACIDMPASNLSLIFRKR